MLHMAPFRVSCASFFRKKNLHSSALLFWIFCVDLLSYLFSLHLGKRDGICINPIYFVATVISKKLCGKPAVYPPHVKAPPKYPLVKIMEVLHLRYRHSAFFYFVANTQI